MRPWPRRFWRWRKPAGVLPSATSGRRSSRSAGRPAGISGGCGDSNWPALRAGRWNDRRVLPARMAMAFSSSSRRCASEAASASVVASSVSAGPRPVRCRCRLQNGCAPACTCSLRKSTVPVTVAISASSERKRKIILRHVGLEREQDVIEICQRGLGIGAGAFKPAPDAAPQIHFVAQIERRAEGVGGQVAEARDLVRRIALPR